MPTRRHASSATRQREVLDAALACFADGGLDALSIEAVCRRSGASVGSVYHQFGSKAGIAAALYLDALADYQRTVGGVLKAATPAPRGVRARVAAHIGWADANPAHARFLQHTRHAEAMVGLADTIAAHNRAFAQAIGAWVAGHVASGRLQALPVDLLVAQWLGPAQEYVRGRLDGRDSTPPARAARLLGDAAWRALGADAAEPAASQGARR